MSDIAIRAENVSKYYKLGQINNGTLFADIQTWLTMKLHREDPHSKIGENRYAEGKEGFWALKDLNFEIHQGDRVGIIGKNGAGKSTLLKILSEITAPTSGEINIKGRVASLLEVGTGFNPEMTGRENIYMNGAILGMKRADITRKLDEIIAFSEIEQHIDTPVKRYSSGMYVRLAFAVAAHLDSEILIADEVLAVGDAAFQKKALGKMKELSTGHGRTVLFVSHNMPSVIQLCNNGILMDHGKIIYSGEIEDTFNKYLQPDQNKSNDNCIYDKSINIEELLLTIKRISISQSIASFRPLEIQIDYESEKEYDDIGFQIMFFDENEKKILTMNPLETENIPFKISKGTKSVVCKINQFPLCAGKYNIGFAVIRPGVKIFYEDKSLINFTVKEEVGNNRLISNNQVYGLFYAKNTWEF